MLDYTEIHRKLVNLSISECMQYTPLCHLHAPLKELVEVFECAKNFPKYILIDERLLSNNIVWKLYLLMEQVASVSISRKFTHMECQDSEKACEILRSGSYEDIKAVPTEHWETSAVWVDYVMINPNLTDEQMIRVMGTLYDVGCRFTLDVYVYSIQKSKTIRDWVARELPLDDSQFVRDRENY